MDKVRTMACVGLEEKRIKMRKKMRSEKEKRKVRGNNIRKYKRKGKGVMDISLSYPLYKARRSCFAKRFRKTDSALP
jgi:hypothetical protein